MAQRVQIMCINKSDRQNPHERIRNVGGVNAGWTRWKLSEDEAIRGIEAGKWDFYTHVDGRTADVIIAVHLGRKYLKTKPDGVRPDNLLALPECP
jgi:hypothetical protein